MVGCPVRAMNRFKLSCTALYGPTLSSIQMLPETSAIVSTSFSWVSESSTGGMFVGTIRLGLSNDVTWKGSPTGFPLTASKRMPHTLKKPSRPDTKYIVFPSGDHRGLSSQCLPSVMRIHGPPLAATTYSVDSTVLDWFLQASKMIHRPL